MSSHSTRPLSLLHIPYTLRYSVSSFNRSNASRQMKIVGVIVS